MRTILAIETSSELASAALSYQGKVIARDTCGVQTHSQSVLPMVQDILGEAGISLSQCDAIAFGAGPGSFTGVRTACGVAQGLAFGADLPVVPVSTLQAMAQACRDATGASDVLVLLDARMEEVYWAQYRFDNEWQTLIAPALSAASAVTPDGTHGNVQACGNGLAAYASVFAAMPFAASGRSDIMPHAAQIAVLAQHEFSMGHAVHARDAQPIYLRNKVALTTAERAAKVHA
ncbi:tRNA (adenosine(37)-N6)-threonylcarbamoyltransferase complex dimerization subunit type 1 TsaB [Noviherbaspirillum sp. Root189]|uniref:tRNA (adenosine(37)-N6)-threonylcarbamoyltransferase complex dimerization subunit type 1 TsaB n=1 Tax=Noviherbaspirillum sp. Root189 TaxID=1736487 RepID=UPI00070F7512|nr:tRNA (adenosine(37)-N6)-threonylcarbamoyltransferase complex dimerization subunit type 1 TsaB [Noviherbaspirillum sp. Root189]KRB93283.1 tRNA threonylcarbamoyladenosine biosynthesis protein TsaB [Noviherbaspirillum sp. Root189]